jgi:predicted TIM-barrel fold metal-dependent hydrolase
LAKEEKPFIVAVEEHYWDPNIAAEFQGGDASRAPTILERLYDLGELRIGEMDAAGIDMQVLSHGAPAAQRLAPERAAELTRRANDFLHAAIARYPTRFAGFAALPTPDPAAAADELERAVVKLGLKGAMVHGLTHGVFLDDARFWPIFERAQALDVPIYLHPAVPHEAVTQAYYQDYMADFPMVIRAAWGYTVEAATQAIRLVLSGVFERYPRLKIILGHMGETLPYLLWRIDQALSRPGHKAMSFRQAFCEHFYITTSGNFSNTALLCASMEIGIDRILFAVDWPFVPNAPAIEWLRSLPLCAEDRAKLLSGNANRLLRLY